MTEQLTITSPAREVFDYWREVFDHPGAKWSPERKTKIEARLKDGFTVDDLKSVCDGVKVSPYHMGLDRKRNPSGTVYDSIDLLYRNVGNVERYMDFAKQHAAEHAPPKPRPAADLATYVHRSPVEDLEANARHWWGRDRELVRGALGAYAEDADLKEWAKTLLGELEAGR